MHSTKKKLALILLSAAAVIAGAVCVINWVTAPNLHGVKRIVFEEYPGAKPVTIDKLEDVQALISTLRLHRTRPAGDPVEGILRFDGDSDSVTAIFSKHDFVIDYGTKKSVYETPPEFYRLIHRLTRTQPL